MRARSTLLLALSLAASAAAAGCGGSDTVGPGELQVAPASTVVVVAAGATAELNVAIARGGGFDGAVTLDAEGLPEGVTVQGTTIPADETSGMLTFAAEPTARSDTATVTITATPEGLGGRITADVTLTVEGEDPSFGFVIGADTVYLHPDQPDTTEVWITRAGGFTGPVTFAVTGMPDGMLAAFAASTVPGDTAALTVTADATVRTDTTFVLAITGSAEGLDARTDSLPVQVQAAGSGASGPVR